MMQRKLLPYLRDWLFAIDRKPLLLRGARQVGKTWLVRQLAHSYDKQLIELNCKKNPERLCLLETNDPKQILLNLSTLQNKKINPANFLLFLDEIQAAPQTLARLRWFATEMPELAVVAASSWRLDDHELPTGRINQLHLTPLSFEEFLLANDKKSLLEYLVTYNFNQGTPLAIHEQLTQLFKEYLLVGGMPACVVSWSSDHSLHKIQQLQQDLLATYRQDFHHYKGRIALERLDEVIMAIPKMLGNKFVFSKVNSTIQTSTIKQVLDLFSKNGLCDYVKSSASNANPLAPAIQDKFFKVLALDIGLCGSASGLSLTQLLHANDITTLNQGALAEQVVGQMLRATQKPNVATALYCWHRNVKGSNAQVDYLIQHDHLVVPVEVKAGSAGSLKALHLFMKLKQGVSTAVRIDSSFPSITPVTIKGQPEYQLLSIPFYLTGQIHRLIDLALQKTFSLERFASVELPQSTPL